MLAVDALAAFRLTRLATEDTIGRPFRHAVIDRAERISPKAGEWAEELVTCPWCIGFWIACGVVVARRAAPRAWAPVAEAFALSGVTGLLAKHA